MCFFPSFTLGGNSMEFYQLSLRFLRHILNRTFFPNITHFNNDKVFFITNFMKFIMGFFFILITISIWEWFNDLNFEDWILKVFYFLLFKEFKLQYFLLDSVRSQGLLWTPLLVDQIFTQWLRVSLNCFSTEYKKNENFYKMMTTGNQSWKKLNFKFNLFFGNKFYTNSIIRNELESLWFF